LRAGRDAAPLAEPWAIEVEPVAPAQSPLPLRIFLLAHLARVPLKALEVRRRAVVVGRLAIPALPLAALPLVMLAALALPTFHLLVLLELVSHAALLPLPQALALGLAEFALAHLETC
jgi:hypothetical protein